MTFDRDVAIKVLPASFVSDSNRLLRFSQEARAASGLNHPNILTVHELGTHEGSPYIVTEQGAVRRSGALTAASCSFTPPTAD